MQARLPGRWPLDPGRAWSQPPLHQELSQTADPCPWFPQLQSGVMIFIPCWPNVMGRRESKSVNYIDIGSYDNIIMGIIMEHLL